MDQKNKILNEAETSLITGLGVQTLRNWRHQKRGIPYSKVGKSVRYTQQDIFEYIEKNKISSEMKKG